MQARPGGSRTVSTGRETDIPAPSAAGRAQGGRRGRNGARSQGNPGMSRLRELAENRSFGRDMAQAAFSWRDPEPDGHASRHSDMLRRRRIGPAESLERGQASEGEACQAGGSVSASGQCGREIGRRCVEDPSIGKPRTGFTKAVSSPIRRPGRNPFTWPAMALPGPKRPADG